MVSSGCREIIRFLVQHRLIDALVTTCGGIEEDFMKCLAPALLGNFQLRGAALRHAGLNRIGNMVVPNANYCAFEDWILPALDECSDAQHRGFHWTPSRLIWKLGRRINDPNSIYYWAWKNHIPVFCPCVTDGALGDCLYFHSFRSPGLIIDVVGDIRALNAMALHSPKTGVICLGGGSAKHHVLNANIFRGDGADFAIYINTASEFDASDSGAPPDEAVSWGKISHRA